MVLGDTEISPPADGSSIIYGDNITRCENGIHSVLINSWSRCSISGIFGYSRSRKWRTGKRSHLDIPEKAPISSIPAKHPLFGFIRTG